MAKFQKYRVLRSLALSAGIAVMLDKDQVARRGGISDLDDKDRERNPGALLAALKGARGVYMLLGRSEFKAGEVIGLTPDSVSPGFADCLGDLDGSLEPPPPVGDMRRDPASIINGDPGIKLRPDGRPDMGVAVLADLVIARRPDGRPDMGGPVPAGFRLVEEPKPAAPAPVEARPVTISPQEGPTVAEWVARGYRASAYPPRGWASRSTDAEIAAAIAEQDAAEQAEAERVKAEQATEAERVAAEQAEAERVKAEQATEAERVAADQAEAERVKAAAGGAGAEKDAPSA